MAFVNHSVFVNGPPDSLLSDNENQFVSKFFQNVCRILGIKNLFTTTYHPQLNGQVERFNRTILAALRHYVVDLANDWDLTSSRTRLRMHTKPSSIGQLQWLHSSWFCHVHLARFHCRASLLWSTAAVPPISTLIERFRASLIWSTAALPPISTLIGSPEIQAS